MPDLLVVVPTRGRPTNVERVIEAWEATGAFADANIMVAFDADDPERDRYAALTAEWAGSGCVSAYELPRWEPMVAKLNAAALEVADLCWAVGFAGDDHLPRTRGWARAYLDALAELDTGIVYGDDRIQGQQLPTQWAMTTDIVRALGRMVPAPVDHLYCDNAVLALGRAAGCIRYLPEVVVEHVHPVAGKVPLDDGYRRVNTPDQYRRDGQAYRAWVRDQLGVDAELVRKLREGVSING